jgi:hypothetical protein
MIEYDAENPAPPQGTWEPTDTGNGISAAPDIALIDETGQVALTIECWHGVDDGVPVLQIDGDSSPLRININDQPIWNFQLDSPEWATIIAAAGKWLNELNDYIIPDAIPSERDAYKEQAAALASALEPLA